MSRCIGIGRVLGHRFAFAGGSVQFDYCFRCGMPAGGWSSGAVTRRAARGSQDHKRANCDSGASGEPS